MLEIEMFEDFIDRDCRSNATFDNKILLERLIEADEIWLSSSWPFWTSSFMADSVKNIRRYNENIVIFGKKSFGFVDSRIYLYESEDQWSNPFLNINENHYNQLEKLNMNLKKQALSSGARFIDTQKLICNGNLYCSNYQENSIISYDGGHLTPLGAKLFGQKLKEEFKGNYVF